VYDTLHLPRQPESLESFFIRRPMQLLDEMERIPGGSFWMGSTRFYREEAPEREIAVGSFLMDRYPVTNARFARFVSETGHLTLAEREPEVMDYPGALHHLLVPGSVVFRRPMRRMDPNNHLAWWSFVPGASWRHPYGPATSLFGLLDHPVVHIAYEDAAAYASWAGKQLPSEAEWERAARGGLDRKDYAWGDDLRPGGRHMANVWQGTFPQENLVEDGWDSTSPVGSFPPNEFGLFDMIGNVWEWTADAWTEGHVPSGFSGAAESVGEELREAHQDPRRLARRIAHKVLKGGSFLCAPNHCARYQPAARIPQQVDTATCHQGFRCIIRLD
jgi:formylglycine-generating enzyme